MRRILGGYIFGRNRKCRACLFGQRIFNIKFHSTNTLVTKYILWLHIMATLGSTERTTKGKEGRKKGRRRREEGARREPPRRGAEKRRAGQGGGQGSWVLPIHDAANTSRAPTTSQASCVKVHNFCLHKSLFST